MPEDTPIPKLDSIPTHAPNMLEIQKILKDFQTDRPVMSEKNSIDFLIGLLRGEVDEFDADRVEDELADIVVFALTIANSMGIDVDEAVRTKVAFNHARYIASEFQEGDYDETRARCKQTEVIWKPVFYPKPGFPTPPNHLP